MKKGLDGRGLEGQGQGCLLSQRLGRQCKGLHGKRIKINKKSISVENEEQESGEAHKVLAVALRRRHGL